jgi:predicted Zn-dependent protease
VIDHKGLVRAASNNRRVADWAIVERDQEIAIARESPGLRRAEHRLGWQLTVHHDTPQGRGSAHVSIDSVEGTPEALVDRSVALAEASVGPAWVSRPLAAPAKVKLADPKLVDREPLDIASEVLRDLARPATASVLARVTVVREKVTVAAHGGLHSEWPATLVRLDALVAAGERSLIVSREARQLASLDGGPALAAAARDLELLATAGAPKPGPCTLVLGPDAMLHDGLGVWAAFVLQADAVVERQGLTRYREHAPIAPGADVIAEPLTIESDGAVDFGVRSAPLGDHGGAVRKFALVENGVAAGLGLTPREAALRRRDPNGGVRNLVVALGTWRGPLDGGNTRLVEVRRLTGLSIDPYTGEASLEIALAVEHAGGKSTPFTGGSIRIDLIDALARARRSATELTRGPYRGPDAVLVDRAELIA